MLYTLLPPTGGGRFDEQGKGLAEKHQEMAGEGGQGIQRCAPQQIRGGMDRFLGEGGELRLFFPDCLPLAAPFILFRLKRQGFSGCYVRSVEGGLYVAARR